MIDGINTRTQNIAEYETVTSQSAVARRDRFPGEIGYANATRLRRSIFYEIDERTGINGRARAGCLRYNSLHPVRQHDKSVPANTKTNLLKPPSRSFPRQLRYRGHSYLLGRRRDCEIYRVVPVRRLAFRWRLMHDSFLGAAPGEKGHVSLSEARALQRIGGLCPLEAHNSRNLERRRGRMGSARIPDRHVSRSRDFLAGWRFLSEHSAAGHVVRLVCPKIGEVQPTSLEGSRDHVRSALI